MVVKRYLKSLCVISLYLLISGCDVVTNVDEAIRYTDANLWRFEEIVSDLKGNVSIEHVDPNLGPHVTDSYKDFDKATDELYVKLQKKLTDLNVKIAHSMRNQQTDNLEFKGVVFTMVTPSPGNHQLIEVIYLEGNRDVKSYIDEADTTCKKINEKGWYACSTVNLR